MASTYETGHGKNLASFKTLISFCTSYGQAYKPAKTSLQLTALDAKMQEAEDALVKLQTSVAKLNKATNERVAAFDGLKSYSTQLVNSLAVSGAAAATIADAKMFNRKLQGQRAEAKPAEVNTETGKAEAGKTISVSQVSYDKQVEHFANLLELLRADADYNPNEEALKVSAISAKLDTLRAANLKVVNEYTAYSNALIKRDEVMYNAITGLISVAAEVKKYILSVYSATSPQYKQVKAIPFRKMVR